MKKILMIGTGGTIASVSTEDGLVPGIDIEELVQKELGNSKPCDLDCIQVLNLDSTNIRPGHWLLIADAIKSHYEDYDGFVVTHGTDTMAYTAAGISYLIQNSRKPIVFTGSQKSSVEENSDAGQNLLDAITFACDDLSCGVQIVFSGSVIIGTRARKNYAKRFMAFGSINYPVIANIRDGKIVRYIPQNYTGDTVFYDFVDPNIGLLKLVPGMRNDVMRYVIDKYDALIIESFGVGGLPEYSDFYDQIKHAVDSGKIIVMTTQVPNEGSDLSVYHVGIKLKKEARILEAHDMTSEAVFAKLAWILGQTSDFAEIEKLFYTPVYNDILNV